MANNLQFTVPVAVPNLTKAKIGLINIDEDASRMEIQINIQGGGGVLQNPSPWVLRLTNGSADGLVADTAATVIGLSMRSVALTGAGVSAAYTTALAAYRAAGGDKRGNLLTALTGITGTISNLVAEVGVLSGTTVPILPVGTVS